MTVLLSGGAGGARLRARLQTISRDEAATTIISYEEQTRGWLARIAQERSVEGQIPIYGRLKRQLQLYCSITVVDFDERAAAEFQQLRRARIRIGTMDLKIAAIALVNDATLLTRNLTDLARSPTCAWRTGRSNDDVMDGRNRTPRLRLRQRRAPPPDASYYWQSRPEVAHVVGVGAALASYSALPKDTVTRRAR